MQCYVDVYTNFIEKSNSIQVHIDLYHLLHFVDQHDLTIHVKHKWNEQRINLHHDASNRSYLGTY
jgi:hypothetical protein